MPESDDPVTPAEPSNIAVPGPQPIPGVKSEREQRRLIAALHIFVLWSFAVAQPLYDLLSTRLRYVNDVGIEPATLVLLTVILSLLCPALLVAVEALAGRVRARGHSTIHIALVALLAGAVLLPLLRRIPILPGLIVVPLGVAGGAAFAWAYHRWRWCRALLTAASPGIVLFPIWFLAVSPVSTLLFPPPPPQSGTATASRPTPIVMVVLDEVSGLSLMTEDREIDGTLYPNFSDLARRATWFRNATTVHPFTDSAVTAILTGKYPRELKRPMVEQHPINLFTLLQATNQYEFVVFEPYTHLFPIEHDVDVRKKASLGQQLTTLRHDLMLAYADHLIPPGFPVDLPNMPPTWFGFRYGHVPPEKMEGFFRYSTDVERAEQFDHFLRCLRPRDKPTLYFMHIVLPHLPWIYLPSGRKYKPERESDWIPAGGLGELGRNWGGDELILAQNRQRYYLQLQYVDRLFGRLIERLQEVGLYDPALLIVMADHGVCFSLNRARRVPEDDTLGDILAIPMFVKAPHQDSGGPSDRNVESIDVLPTILGTLDYQPPVTTDGHDMLDARTAPRTEKLFFFVSGEEPRPVAADCPETRDVLPRVVKMREESLSSSLGPAQELVGRAVSTLVLGTESLLSCHWMHMSDDVQKGGPLPCLVQGTVTPTPKPDQPVTLAVAVNGIIAGVTRTYQLKAMPEQWSSFFPEASFRAGKNSLDLYEVRGQEGRFTLHRMKTTRTPEDLLQ